MFPQGLSSPLLDLLNAHYLIVPRADRLDPADASTVLQRYSEVYADRQIRILENPSALPRAWIVHTALHVDPDATLAPALIAGGEVDAWQTAVAERPSITEATCTLYIERLPRDEWQVLIRDAQVGYISWDDSEHNLHQLRQAAHSYGVERRASPPREGSARLQGLVICGRSGSRMTVRYGIHKEREVTTYVCMRAAIQHARRFANVCMAKRWMPP